MPAQSPLEINPQPEPEPTATLSPATYYFFEPGVNPLTGIPVNTLSNLERRPVMVKVSNWPRSGRPHAGLSQADLVFEYYIGQKMNRFLAVYYGDNSEKIGPVRSGRLVDAQLANLYQGILAYGNADPQVDEVLIEFLGNRALAFKNLPCPPMCGSTTHSVSGVFADSDALSEYVEEKGVDNDVPDLRGMFFQDDPLLGSETGTQVEIVYANYSVMAWHYDEINRKYHLWEEVEVGEGFEIVQMTDRNTHQPVIFDNVVVMFAEYIEYAPSLHDIVVQNVVTAQPALFFRDGVLTYGTWRVSEPDCPILFETTEGGPLALKPGKTWIVIVGMRSQTMQSAGGEWEIYFDLP